MPDKIPNEPSPLSQAAAGNVEYLIQERDNMGPTPGWVPVEVVVVYWNLDMANRVCRIAPNSGVYPYSAVSSFGSIAEFARAADEGRLPPVPANLSVNPDIYPQPWDFAIDKSCYIVFVLKQHDEDYPWKFDPGSRGVTFKASQDGWYSDLMHINPHSVDNYARGHCKTCYFSAYVDTDQSLGSDGFNLHFMFWIGSNPCPNKFDPAIKNKGHVHGLLTASAKDDEINIPTPFKVPPVSDRASDATRTLLSSKSLIRMN